MFPYSSKWSTPNIFSLSWIWEILWKGSAIFKFTVLLNNQVKWILLAVLNWRHRYANCWFSWGLLSIINSLPTNRNCVRSEHLSFKSFRLKRTFCLCLQNFNLKMTRSRFSKPWHEWSCSGVTLTWVKDKALQTFSSKHFLLNKPCHILTQNHLCQNFSMRSESFNDTSDKLSNYSTSSSLLMFSVWRLVKTMTIDLKLNVRKIIIAKVKMATAINNVC